MSFTSERDDDRLLLAFDGRGISRLKTMNGMVSHQRLWIQRGILTTGTRRCFNGSAHSLVGWRTLADRRRSTNLRPIPRYNTFLCPSVSPHSQYLSTQADPPEEGNGDNDEIVLYMRNTERVKLSRTNFAFSCSFSAFSIWYTGYLTPFINAAQHIDVEIDPISGYLAMIMAGSLQLIFTLYPKRCISKMTVTLGTARTPPILRIYGYTLPLIDTAPKPREYQFGQVTITPKDAEDIFFSSPLATGHYYLQISSEEKAWPQVNVLDLWNDRDVPEPELLMNILTKPRLAARELENRREQRKKGRRYRLPEREDVSEESPLQNIVRHARLRNRR